MLELHTLTMNCSCLYFSCVVEVCSMLVDAHVFMFLFFQKAGTNMANQNENAETKSTPTQKYDADGAPNAPATSTNVSAAPEKVPPAEAPPAPAKGNGPDTMTSIAIQVLNRIIHIYFFNFFDTFKTKLLT